ncbi:MAG: DUF4185 domain-containing protein [Streptosporangiales bacterium]
MPDRSRSRGPHTGSTEQPGASGYGTSRRRFLTVSGAALVGGGASALSATDQAQAAPVAAHGHGGRSGGELPTRDAIPAGELDQTTSTLFSTAFVQSAGTVAAKGSDGDLWPSCWADDDHVYSANGDGRGFSDEPFKDIVVNRITGTPRTGLSGTKLAEADEVGTIWGDPDKYNRKPTGMVCVDGVLYLAIQDLRHGKNAFDDAPNASISRSDDHGRTWQKTSEPMFTDHRFTTIFFVDFGKDSREAIPALGREDGGYVYAYGMDWNWRASNTGTVPDPTALFLARVRPKSVQDRSEWRFFTGTDHGGRPTWSARIEDKVPVLADTLRRYPDTRPGKAGNLSVVSQGGVLYNAGLRRYIYTSWTDPSFEFYEAPTPWGPWKRFLYHNFGRVEWYQMSDEKHTPKSGGYATTIPSKFVEDGGQLMWVQSNWWTPPRPHPEDNYNFNLRQLRVTPYRKRPPRNGPNAQDNIARTGKDVTPVQVCPHFAHRGYYNNGDRSESEDSFDGANKLTDHWGYTFSRPYRMDRVVYTTGAKYPDGGWFSPYAGGLRVQVRQEFDWVDVEDLRIRPDYPYDQSATPHNTYMLDFRRTWGDGVRIIGQPGGEAHFTSIAELELYFRGH